MNHQERGENTGPLADTLAILLLLVGGMLLAARLRVLLPVGLILGDEYRMLPPSIFVLLLLAAAVSAVVLQVTGRQLTPARRRMVALLLAEGFAVGAVWVLLPDVSHLQVLYFAAISLLLGLVTLGLAPKQAAGRSLMEHLRLLWANRVLLFLWIRYNVLSRYSQTILGIMWIVLLPLSTALILAYVFSHILHPTMIHNASFVSFFLAGLTAWGLFSQGINNGVRSVLSKMYLINQVAFPREILVLVSLGEALVDFTFTCAALLVINAIIGVFPNGYYLYLLPLLAVQVILTLGLMLFVSYLSVLVRDVPQLVNVLLQLLFYSTPILYPPETLPQDLRLLIYINPMAPLIEGFRAVMVYGQAPDMLSLSYPLVLGCALLVLGYQFFKQHEKRLADFV